MTRHRRTAGMILVTALVFGAVLTTMAVALVNYTALNAKVTRASVAEAQALALAEAGIDKAVYELNQNGSYTGESNTPLGAGVVTITVTNIDANSKRISATASVPNSTSPRAQASVHATASINTSVVAFHFGVQVGEGGVSMGNGAEIIGNIFSNGSISGSGTVTGDATVAAGTAGSPDQSWTTENGTVGLGDVAARASVAQSFRPSTSSTLNKIQLYVRKVGNPNDITIRVMADDAGRPSGTVLVTAVIPSSHVADDLSFAEAALESLIQVQADQTYWLVASLPVSSTSHYEWAVDTLAGYSRGEAAASAVWDDPDAWSAVQGDLNFKIFLAGNQTSLSQTTVEGNAWAQQLSNCTIHGDATFQSATTNCTVSGTKYPNATSSPPGLMPISEAHIRQWEEDAEAGGVHAGDFTISNNGSATLGPRKITGKLTVSNGATLTLTGPVWVTGDISFSNTSHLQTSASLGNRAAILIADAPGEESSKGKVTLTNGMQVSGNGNPGSYPMILTTNTSGSAISLGNNAEGIILYATAGTVQISNNAQARQITAHRLQMSNNSQVVYESGLSNSNFSGGPGGSWAIVPGTYAITP
ncbi:hypothetical protein COU20_03010 [Candidatus Kaiserbacteria bacterium CG10_big_fil_rev_8_21_14_0_10_59_10]|uniref:Type 4 fimbrial biogenesis protein PilX N-terminal domain-containing protein n=1 Tax=Candidatus Kaiserbacteria bacterium CG10_big_fil_rev_8_21_14_0_10_59_10 TaxID=1974612 RepID=A0A2H0U968_9BACT|nr:MAG: hypothetical protein COU20_03010 [Candidatus Kaiserbacteria bacterium CG10_big_fil_rev_8_21_14_0_10_59_10]